MTLHLWQSMLICPRSTRHDTKDAILERIKRIEEATAEIGVFRRNATSFSSLTSSSFEAPLVSARKNQSNSPPTGPAQSNGQIYFSGLQLGTVDSRSGMPSLSRVGIDWIFKATGQSPSFEYLSNGGSDFAVTSKNQPASSRKELRVSPSQKPELPKRSMVESLLQIFLESDLPLVFPIIDQVLFGDTLNTAYGLENEGDPTQRLAAKACVFAFACFVGVYLGDTDLGSSIDVDSYASESNILVSSILEEPSLTMLQTMLMLGLYNVVSGRFRTGTMLHAAICRALFILGGHAAVSAPMVNDEPLSLRQREDRQLRWIFWLCYTFDKDISLRTGQPCLLHDEFCDLTLPQEYFGRRFALKTQSHDRSSPSRYREEDLLLPCDLRLSIIKSKACRLLYSTPALKKSDAELLRSIRELDEEVEDWRVSLLPNSAPSFSIPKLSTWSLGSSMRKSMQHAELHLQYHHLLSAIHHASGRCESLKRHGTEQARASILESSLALSVEASRSTLMYLSVAVHGLTSEAAW
ncbi:hypothetical protein AK830_g7330 [Neonectria ditissima]|uniref:Xylanolytic transcriptional activator regulatory domain-containing protein n=1 Tax=Neonectria ditissima TaxID=78410 RepID=A0A0P7BFM8_9HYPO|nr:hypothetical protein AK830_g7330 [Neonectria ditissima]